MMASGAVRRVFNQTVKLHMEMTTQLELKRVDLKPVKQILVAYDPWKSDCASAQQFFYNISLDEVRETNPAASIRTEVKSDQSDPTVRVTFNDGAIVTYQTRLLGLHDILYHLNATIHAKKSGDAAREPTAGK